MRRPWISEILFVLYKWLLRSFRHTSTKFLRLFQSVARCIGIVDIPLCPIVDQIISIGRFFFFGFLIRTFRTRLSPARQTWPARFDRFDFTDIRLVCIIFLDRRFYVSLIPHVRYEWVRDFSAKLFFRSWVVFLRLPVLWIMSRVTA